MGFSFLRCVLIAAGLVAAASSAHAQALYKCTDEDSRVSYVDSKNRGTLKNCKVLSQDLPVSTVPGQKPRAAATPTPGSFPKVNGDTQKNRDTERRRILEQELSTEQQALDKARQELSEQEAVRTGDERNYQRVLDRLQPYKDKVELHQRNVDALKREIANLK